MKSTDPYTDMGIFLLYILVVVKVSCVLLLFRLSMNYLTGKTHKAREFGTEVGVLAFEFVLLAC